jgi:HEAT repeat protein/ATP/ADP translocase
MDGSRRLDRWLEATFRLHPGELWPTLLLFLLCHALVGAFVVARSVRDTLFLARVSPEALPLVYVFGSAAVVAAGGLYTRLLAQRRPTRVMPATALAFAAAMGLARLAAGGAGPVLASALYAGVEVMGAITLLQFWSFAGSVHDSREAKRLFALIAAGGTLAGAAWGFAVGVLARSVGLANLFGLVALLLVAAAGLGVLAAQALGPRAWATRGATETALAPERGVDPYTRTVAVVVALTFLTTTLVDYQFKLAAGARFGRDTAELARYFGMLSGAIGAASLVLQLGFTNRILARLGVAGSLALLPAALALGSAGTLLAGGLLAVALTKAAEQTLRYTVNDAAMQLLYVPLPTRRRARAKSAVDAVVRPATIAAAGALLLLFQRVALGPLLVAGASLFLAALWLASLLGVHTRYLGVLRDTLRRRRLDVPDASPRLQDEARKAVRRALASGDPAEIEGALALAPRLDAADLAGDVVPLLGHARARIRLLACEALASTGPGTGHPALLPLLRDPDPAVRAAAISACCATSSDGALSQVRPFLSAPELGVRGAAVAGLIRHAGLDGILAAADGLKALLGSPHAEERAEAARVLARIGVKNFFQPVQALLADTDASVRRAALEAAGSVRSLELLPALLRLLGRRDTARAAAEALVAFGPGVEGRLARALADPREDPELRRRLARVLGRLGTDEAATLLVDHVDDDDEGLRGAVALALARAVRRRPGLAVDRPRVGQALQVELLLAWRATAAAEALGLSEGRGPPPRGAAEGARHLLATALREKVDMAVDRALLLARVLRPDADLDLARARLADRSPARRAAAVEMLDSVLDQRLRRRLVPLVDQRPRSARLREAESLYRLPRLDADGWLGELLRDEGAWIPAVSAHAAGLLGFTGAAPRVRELLQHPSPFVREAALGALGRLLSRPQAAAAARELTADPFEPTRAQALALVAVAGAGRPPEGSPR